MGPTHPDTLASVGALASLLKALGKLQEAEPLYRRALLRMEEVLGPAHHDTLNLLINLAVLLKAQGFFSSVMTGLGLEQAHMWSVRLCAASQSS